MKTLIISIFFLCCSMFASAQSSAIKVDGKKLYLVDSTGNFTDSIVSLFAVDITFHPSSNELYIHEVLSLGTLTTVTFKKYQVPGDRFKESRIFSFDYKKSNKCGTDQVENIILLGEKCVLNFKDGSYKVLDHWDSVLDEIQIEK